jgi:hypothetical protein
MIESFRYGTWIGGQVPYCFFRKRPARVIPAPRAMQSAEFRVHPQLPAKS